MAAGVRPFRLLCSLETLTTSRALGPAGMGDIESANRPVAGR